MTDQVAELKQKLAEKTAENAKLIAECASLKEKVAELTEKLKAAAEGLGADKAKELLGNVMGGSDAAEDDGSKVPDKEAVAEVAKDPVGALGAKLGGFGF